MSEIHNFEISNSDQVNLIHFQVSKDLLTMLISSEYLRVDSEYQVFLATMNWINYDIANR